jgi:hypothetical protein
MKYQKDPISGVGVFTTDENVWPKKRSQQIKKPLIG